jgi:hypothetical protein
MTSISVQLPGSVLCTDQRDDLLTQAPQYGAMCQFLLRKEVVLLPSFAGLLRNYDFEKCVPIKLLISKRTGIVAPPKKSVKNSTEIPSCRLPRTVLGRRAGQNAIIQVLADGLTQCLFAHPEVILGGRRDVLVSGQFFDECDICPVVP